MIRLPHFRRSSARTHRHHVQVESLEARRLLAAGAGSSGLAQAYGQLPLSFESNRGQTDAQVLFLARGSGSSLFITPTEAVLSLGGSSTVRMQLIGANPAAAAVGLVKLPGVSNYLIGNDPSLWHTNVPSFARVQEQGVYPGVDLTYYGNQRQLEYDFTVAPGADPGAIKLSFQGADSTTLDAQGNLVLHTTGGDVVEHAPVLYQESGGVRQPVSGRYAIGADGRVGFAAGAYDAGKPLVIDPTLSYSTYLGGNGPGTYYNTYTDGAGFGIAVDATGAAYVTGSTTSADFPTADPLQPTKGGGSGPVVVVSKFDPSGRALVYSTFLGGAKPGFAFADASAGSAIAVDAAGNAYVTGRTAGTFPTVNALQPAYGGGKTDAFVAKLNAAGSSLVYSTFLGGRGSDYGNGIAVDAAGNAYVTGQTVSPDFPTRNALQPAFGGNINGYTNAFVAKLNAAGSSLVYSTYLGGVSNISSEAGNAIAVDAAGNAYVTGTAAAGFPTTPGALQPSMPGLTNAFVTKLNTSGSALVYSTFLGGGSGNGLAVDAAGSAYVTGSPGSADFPTTPGAFRRTPGGIFVTKLTPSGSGLVYSTYLGGTGQDSASGIAVDAAGSAYVTGTTNSQDFPTVDPVQPVYGGPEPNRVSRVMGDAFVTKFSSDGSSLAYSTFLGGSADDVAGGIAVDPAGSAYVTGYTYSTDFPTVSAFQPAKGSDSHGISATSGFQSDNAFVAKIASGPATTFRTTTTLAASSNNPAAGRPVTFTATVSAAPGVSGTPTGTVTFRQGYDKVLGSAPLDPSGRASFTTPALSTGLTFVTAAYNSDARFISSRGVVSLRVGAVTDTTLSVSPTPSTLGQPVTFTAIVTGAISGDARPTGTVVFYQRGRTPDTVPLGVDGRATLVTIPAIGSQQVVADYSGDSSFIMSQAVADVSVDRATTFTKLTATPAAPAAGQSVTLSATVASTNTVDGPLSGTVFFQEGTTVLGTASVGADGRAALTTSALAAGAHALTAMYTGDGPYNASTGAVTVTVGPGPIVPLAGPVVVGVRRYGYHLMPTTLLVTFDGPLDPASARDVRNYKLTGPGGRRLPVGVATYDPVTYAVTLHPRRRLDLRHHYVLTVVGTDPGGLRGFSGHPLNSATGGQAGGDTRVNVDATNFVATNPFARGASAALKLAARARAALAPHAAIHHRP